MGKNCNKNLTEGPTFPHSIQIYEKSRSHQWTVDQTNNEVFLKQGAPLQLMPSHYEAVMLSKLSALLFASKATEDPTAECDSIIWH